MDSLWPYPDPDTRVENWRSDCARLGAATLSYGESVEGRSLDAAVLRRPGRPRVVVCAVIHGVEYLGNCIAAGFLRSLDGSSLTRRAEVWVLPCLNPDGYARTWVNGGQGPLKTLRGNARGVDLNRNFPLPFGATPSRIPGSGSYRPQALTYRGPAPLSEPESRDLAAFLACVDPHVCVSLHSFMGTIIPPPVLCDEDRCGYRDLARAFAAAQTHVRYRRLRIPFDVFTGELEDHAHHVLGAWAVCIESFTLSASWRQHPWAPSRFWRFNPRQPGPWVDSDVAGLHGLLHAALDRPRPARVSAAMAPPRRSWTGP